MNRGASRYKKPLDLSRKAAWALSTVKDCPVSLCLGFLNRKLFEEVRTYCMFVGYPRSGHTLIGALLDAHPMMIVAHELDVLRYVSAGFNRLQIYYLLLRTSRVFAEEGRERGGYFYNVPNQWQGKFRKLRVIGDKKGEGTIWKLLINPGLLQRLRSKVGIPVRCIHVVRNPYDNIARISLRNNLTMDSSLDY